MAAAPPLPQIPLVLDNDVLRAWRYQEEPVKQNIFDYERIHKRLPALTSVTVYEALVGYETTIAQRGGNDERTERDRDEALRLVQLFGSSPSGPSPSGVLPFDETAATIAASVAGQLSKQLAKKKTGASLMRDIFLTATALAHYHGVATRNEKDFQLIGEHVPLLYLAIWKR